MNSLIKNSTKNLIRDANGNIVEKKGRAFEPIPFDGRGGPLAEEMRKKAKEKGPYVLDVNRMNQMINETGNLKTTTSTPSVVAPPPGVVAPPPSVVAPPPGVNTPSHTKKEFFTTENILIGVGILFVIFLMKK